ncbi:hypothetical protein ONS95_014244 [Cadophora gregata]|uniref:uncharacterized protein n=1 Tax=Cadophora gregata TaxID=51156 RepID=UPI0026DB69BD|nr:uncharacterized protein ONS95_014244 [Cadophora gregata]KAK0114001.1 hypothetical protein ONS96_014848 [Cadophora gregata f. sp. sojae]KAK0114760.1 hypothetical protein ONS95_014244 [Cadophora gregata]
MSDQENSQPTPSTSSPAPAESSYREATRSLKLDPEGVVMLGHDGVMRSFDGSYERNVVDAVAFSPAQIKNFLDRFPEPWSQETEDKFRGVDGRNVVGEEALFHPADDLRPPKYTEEDKVRLSKEVEEKNRQLREKIEKEKSEGVDVAAKYACGRVTNDYDLSPKGV